VLHLLSSYGANAIVAPLSSDDPEHSARKAVNQSPRPAKRRGNRVLLVGRVRELALYRAKR
jgi:hypothetical protein